MTVQAISSSLIGIYLRKDEGRRRRGKKKKKREEEERRGRTRVTLNKQTKFLTSEVSL